MDFAGLQTELAPDRGCLAALFEHRRCLALLGKVVGCFDDRQFSPSHLRDFGAHAMRDAGAATLDLPTFMIINCDHVK